MLLICEVFNLSQARSSTKHMFFQRPSAIAIDGERLQNADFQLAELAGTLCIASVNRDLDRQFEQFQQSCTV